MQSVDPLAQLHDIILPQAVSWWPIAWGWWIVLALLIFFAAGIVFFRRRHLRRQSYRVAATNELNQIFLQYQQHQNASEYLQHLSILLRRTAISAQPHTFPVDVKGEAWLQWLDKYCPATRRGFSTGPGRVLLTGPYEADPHIDVQALHALAELWLQQHRNRWQKVSAEPAAAAEVKQDA